MRGGAVGSACCTGHHFGGGRGVGVDEPELQRRGAADDVLGARRVLHPRQLHHDAVGALLLDHRLGHAELVDALVQGLDVLPDGLALDVGDRLGREPAEQTHAAVGRLDGPLHRRQAVEQDVLGLGRFGRVGQGHGHAVGVTREAREADPLLAQRGAGVAGIGVDGLLERAAHVHLHQEVDATAQVQAQVHRQRVQAGHPGRRARDQVERDDVARVGRVGVERPGQRILGLELGVGVGEARAHRVAVELHEIGLHTRALQDLLDAADHPGIDLHRGLAARDLHRRRLAVEVGQRVEQAHQQRDAEERVLPQGITVHRDFLGPREGRPRWRRLSRCGAVRRLLEGAGTALWRAPRRYRLQPGDDGSPAALRRGTTWAR